MGKPAAKALTPLLGLDHLTAIVPDAAHLSDVLHIVTGQAPASSIALPGMQILTFRFGDVELHVNQPTGPGPVATALEKSGPSLHHLAFRCEDLDATLERLRAQGIEAHGVPVETAPGLREVFLSPSATGGLFIQLVERDGDGVVHELDGSAVLSLAQVGASSRT